VGCDNDLLRNGLLRDSVPINTGDSNDAVHDRPGSDRGRQRVSENSRVHPLVLRGDVRLERRDKRRGAYVDHANFHADWSLGNKSAVCNDFVAHSFGDQWRVGGVRDRVRFCAVYQLALVSIREMEEGGRQARLRLTFKRKYRLVYTKKHWRKKYGRN